MTTMTAYIAGNSHVICLIGAARQSVAGQARLCSQMRRFW